MTSTSRSAVVPPGGNPGGSPPTIDTPDLVVGPSRQPFPNRPGVRVSRISVTGSTMSLRLAVRETRVVSLAATLSTGGYPLPAFVLPSALGLVAVALSIATLCVAARADRATRWHATASLHAAPVGYYTRRFAARAMLGLVGEEIVAVDGVGAEQWLPLTGAGRAARFVVVRDDDRLVGVRLERADGSLLAALAGEDWFGPDYDPDGPRALANASEHRQPGEPPAPPAELAAFAAARGLAVSTVAVVLGEDGNSIDDNDGDGPTWPVEAAAAYSCLPPRQVFDGLARRDGLPTWGLDAVAYVAGVTFGALLLTAAAVEGESQFLVPGSLFAATAALCFLRYTVPALYRRLWWDRPRDSRDKSPSIRED